MLGTSSTLHVHRFSKSVCLFCCLFLAFRMFCFLLFGRPAQTAKNKHAPALSPITPQQNLIFSKKPPVQTALFGLEARSFLLFGRAGLFVFLLFRRVVVFVFLLFRRVVVFMFLLFGRGASVFFAVWAAGVFIFCCLGGGVFHFLLIGRATGVHSLTGLPGSSLRGPTTKKTRVPIASPSLPLQSLQPRCLASSSSTNSHPETLHNLE